MVSRNGDQSPPRSTAITTNALISKAADIQRQLEELDVQRQRSVARSNLEKNLRDRLVQAAERDRKLSPTTESTTTSPRISTLPAPLVATDSDAPAPAFNGNDTYSTLEDSIQLPPDSAMSLDASMLHRRDSDTVMSELMQRGREKDMDVRERVASLREKRPYRLSDVVKSAARRSSNRDGERSSSVASSPRKSSKARTFESPTRVPRINTNSIGMGVGRGLESAPESARSTVGAIVSPNANANALPPSKIPRRPGSPTKWRFRYNDSAKPSTAPTTDQEPRPPLRRTASIPYLAPVNFSGLRDPHLPTTEYSPRTSRSRSPSPGTAATNNPTSLRLKSPKVSSTAFRASPLPDTDPTDSSRLPQSALHLPDPSRLSPSSATNTYTSSSSLTNYASLASHFSPSPSRNLSPRPSRASPTPPALVQVRPPEKPRGASGPRPVHRGFTSLGARLHDLLDDKNDALSALIAAATPSLPPALRASGFQITPDSPVPPPRFAMPGAPRLQDSHETQSALIGGRSMEDTVSALPQPSLIIPPASAPAPAPTPVAAPALEEEARKRPSLQLPSEAGGYGSSTSAPLFTRGDRLPRTPPAEHNPSLSYNTLAENSFSLDSSLDQRATPMPSSYAEDAARAISPASSVDSTQPPLPSSSSFVAIRPSRGSSSRSDANSNSTSTSTSSPNPSDGYSQSPPQTTPLADQLRAMYMERRDQALRNKNRALEQMLGGPSATPRSSTVSSPRDSPRASAAVVRPKVVVPSAPDDAEVRRKLFFEQRAAALKNKSRITDQMYGAVDGVRQEQPSIQAAAAVEPEREEAGTDKEHIAPERDTAMPALEASSDGVITVKMRRERERQDRIAKEAEQLLEARKAALADRIALRSKMYDVSGRSPPEMSRVGQPPKQASIRPSSSSSAYDAPMALSDVLAGEGIGHREDEVEGVKARRDKERLERMAQQEKDLANARRLLFEERQRLKERMAGQMFESSALTNAAFGSTTRHYAAQVPVATRTPDFSSTTARPPANPQTSSSSSSSSPVPVSPPTERLPSQDYGAKPSTRHAWAGKNLSIPIPIPIPIPPVQEERTFQQQQNLLKVLGSRLDAVVDDMKSRGSAFAALHNELEQIKASLMADASSTAVVQSNVG
mmetsp:Transcript_40621/g.65913  ORF Transcript_40621/g.65913 Transcript_40621/m.65913 type:complete len:1135 (-) Transcript_40621:142-3546(-)|eukprot:CAMPEP_0184646818 /NCGR_PEP_ID=MMETSP0308-20130426/3613_1 /TAXON_ID=38269 /ORGANISM="Gloeochaete witrockiana, Strain SAG 46.84" /LENGTH=1134 /DNA_ID=CAMNT_0027077215 /DNA_START=144 /DNA_END=3548 /DNA_ORIENTATION=-